MRKRKAYQTLEDRYNYDEVEQEGPFPCNHKHAWLGKGYYYWDSFIENAHWWGVEGAKYNNSYIICESIFVLDEERCFNLVDNPNHFNDFNSARQILNENGMYDAEKTTVARVIEYLKEVIKVFNYEAIRVYGINSVSFNSPFSNRTFFTYREEKKSYQYLDSTPAIQICFYTKKSLDLKGFKIVYPIEYSDEYLV